jgi:hypothetical protein
MRHTVCEDIISLGATLLRCSGIETGETGEPGGDSIAKEVDKGARDPSIKAEVDLIWGSRSTACVIPERSKPFISIFGIGW